VTQDPSKDKSGRRAFLRKAGKALAGAIGGGALLAEGVAQDEHVAGAGTGQSFPTEDYDWTEHRWAYGIDATRCIGCLRCVEACKTAMSTWRARKGLMLIATMIHKTSLRRDRKASIASTTATRMPTSPKPSSCRRYVIIASTRPAFRYVRWGQPSGPRTASY
jgi:ferredoxin